MQKVVGSNPISRSRKGLHLQVFSLSQSPCSSASGRTDSGLAVRRSSAAPRKTPGLQADSRSSELKSFCRPAEGRVFCRLRPIAGFLQTAPLAVRLPAGAIAAIPVRGGASPISVRKPRGRPRPLRDAARQPRAEDRSTSWTSVPIAAGPGGSGVIFEQPVSPLEIERAVGDRSQTSAARLLISTDAST